MSIQDKKSYILQELKKAGCRITSQRKILLDVILQDECCSCKEIYYQAIKEDPGGDRADSQEKHVPHRSGWGDCVNSR